MSKDIQANMMASLGATGGRTEHPNGHLSLEFEVKPNFKHAGGVAQGGFVTGWLDAAMAQALIRKLPPRAWPATLELKVSFLQPAVEGTVVATGWILRQGKSTAFVEAKLEDARGNLLATASSTCRIILPKAKPPG